MTLSPELINPDGNRTAKAGSETRGVPEKAGGSAARQIPQPYPGLRSFRQNEAALFFAREIQARQLRDILAERNLVVVLGGSGSGKSSLVRAGLLPKLNSTAPIPKRSGAWYVVEFRPRTDPAEELLDAIYQQIFQPLLASPPPQATEGRPESNGGATPGTANSGPLRAQLDRRYAAISAALKIETPLEPGEQAEVLCKKQLRRLLLTGEELDVGLLFKFADETIVMLDEKLAGGPRAGRANLLLLIDQFEEVFSLPADRAKSGLDLVMSLVTDIQTYQPFNLFLIVTMRNEWLHRCSEVPGVAEAMNGSTYLVDLLAGPEVEKIIVEPARAVLRAAGLNPGPPGIGPYAKETLSALRNAFESKSGLLAADQLPLLQHLLPLLWDKAVADWAKGSGASPLSIKVEHVEAVLGWTSANPLSSCLNENADGVLARAIAAAMKSVPSDEGAHGLSEQEARQFLQVAFCSLAVLDDKGIVRRRFATIDQMLSASGLSERNPGKRDLKNALSNALAEFESATLINCSKTPKDYLYDINHEALVRNWETYAGWVKSARNVEDRLRDLDEKATRADAAKKASYLATMIEDAFLAENLRMAANDIGSETSDLLKDQVFGNSATFSRTWTRQVLGPENFALRRTKMEERIRDAQRFRNNPWNRYRALAVPGVIAAGALAIVFTAIGVFAYYQSRLNEELQRAAALHTVEQGAATGLLDRSQFAEAYSKAKIVLSLTDERRSKYEILQNIMESALSGSALVLSSQLSRGVWLRASMSGDKEIQKQNATCIVSGTHTILPAPNGIAWSPDRGGNWAPRWKDAQPNRKFIAPPDDDWPPGSVICASPDGNWQFIWLANKIRSPDGFTPKDAPTIRNIQWMKQHPSSGVELSIVVETPGRSVTDTTSRSAYPELWGEFPRLSQTIQETAGPNNSVVKFIQDGHWVGFSIPISESKTVNLWTAAGVNEPEEIVNEPEEMKTTRCMPTARAGSKGCSFGPLAFATGQSPSTNRTYSTLVEWSKEEGDGFRECEEPGATCPITITVTVTTKSQPNLVLRKIKRWSTLIKEGGLTEDGYLWLRDDSRQTWRYLVDPAKLFRLHEDTWREQQGKLEFSADCIRLNCEGHLPPTVKGR